MAIHKNPAKRLIGLALEYAHWKGWRRKVYGNPPAVVGPHAPKQVPPKRRPTSGKPRPNPSPAKTKTQTLIALVDWELAHRGRLIYSEDWKLRQEFFHSDPHKPTGVHADCSQFGAGCLNHAGFLGFTDTDYTGTLWHKGRAVTLPKAGDGIIYGAYPGQHFAFYMGAGWTTGFGGPGGPDHVQQSDMVKFFADAGHPGVRYLRFA